MEQSQISLCAEKVWHFLLRENYLENSEDTTAKEKIATHIRTVFEDSINNLNALIEEFRDTSQIGETVKKYEGTELRTETIEWHRETYESIDVINTQLNKLISSIFEKCTGRPAPFLSAFSSLRGAIIATDIFTKTQNLIHTLDRQVERRVGARRKAGIPW